MTTEAMTAAVETTTATKATRRICCCSSDSLLQAAAELLPPHEEAIPCKVEIFKNNCYLMTILDGMPELAIWKPQALNLCKTEWMMDGRKNDVFPHDLRV